MKWLNNGYLDIFNSMEIGDKLQCEYLIGSEIELKKITIHNDNTSGYYNVGICYEMFDIPKSGIITLHKVSMNGKDYKNNIYRNDENNALIYGNCKNIVLIRYLDCIWESGSMIINIIFPKKFNFGLE